MNADDLHPIMDDILMSPAAPGLLIFDPEAKAAFEATMRFIGRDRRRLKREVRKARLKARREHPRKVGGIDRTPASFWRVTGS